MQPQTFTLIPSDQANLILSEDTAKQLTTAILTLNETLKKQSNCKSIYDYELWSLEHIAEHCHLSIPSIRKLTARPSFPESIKKFGEHGTKLWEQIKVKKWLLQNEGKLPVKRTKK